MLQWAVFAVLLFWPVAAQNTGRFTELTGRALDLIERGRFQQAINLLEEVWEQDRSNPAVVENLGLAHLYADRDVAKARQFMEQAIRAGGRASFLMHHAHEKVAVIATEMSDYCSGRLSIYPGFLTFTAGTPEHSFRVEAAEFKEIKANRWFGKGEGVYHIRTENKKNYNLRPRSWSEQEMGLVLEMVSRYVKKP